MSRPAVVLRGVSKRYLRGGPLVLLGCAAVLTLGSVLAARRR